MSSSRIRRSGLVLLASLGSFLLGAELQAQQLNLVLKSGDQVLGNGKIDRIGATAVNDNGLWYVNVHTDQSGASDVTLLNGFMIMVQGTPMASPFGADFAQPLGLSVNNEGYIGWPVKINGPTITNATNTAIYWNTILMAQQSSNTKSDNINGIEFNSPIYAKFDYVYLNDHDTMMVVGKIEEGKKRDTIGVMTTDGAGNLLTEQWLVAKAYPLAGGTEDIKSIGGDKGSFAFNNNEEWMAQVQFDTTNTIDTAIVKNGQILVREGDPHQVHAGRLYDDLALSRLGMNDFGEYVYTGYLNGNAADNIVVMVGDGNGPDELFAQEAFGFPSIAPETLLRVSSASFLRANSGDVFWYGETTGTGGETQFYFRNHDIIVQQGVTVIGPGPLNGLRIDSTAFAISNTGRFWLGKVELANGNEALVLADFGALVPVYGCGINSGSLKKVSGDARLGQKVTFELDDPTAAIGAAPFFFWSQALARPGEECGQILKVGEILIDTRKIFVRQAIKTFYTGSPIPMSFSIPNDPSLVDLQSWGQAFLVDPDGKMHLSNAYCMEIGN